MRVQQLLHILRQQRAFMFWVENVGFRVYTKSLTVKPDAVRVQQLLHILQQQICMARVHVSIC